MCVCVSALVAGLKINTFKSPGLLLPAHEAVINSEDSADGTSDPENLTLNRNDCGYSRLCKQMECLERK